MAHRRRGRSPKRSFCNRQESRPRNMSCRCVAKQVSRCREASVAKQVSRSNCGEASVEATLTKCPKQVLCEASVAKQPVAKRGATCRAHKKRRNNSSPETIAFNRKTNGHVCLSQPKTTMCSLRTTCFLLLVVVFRWHPIYVEPRKPRMRIRSHGLAWSTVPLCAYYCACVAIGYIRLY